MKVYKKNQTFEVTGWKNSMKIHIDEHIHTDSVMINLVWVNTYISVYGMHNSALLYATCKRFILVCVYLLHNWQP